MKKHSSKFIFIPVLIILGIVVLSVTLLSNFNPPIQSVEVVIPNDRFKN